MERQRESGRERESERKKGREIERTLAQRASKQNGKRWEMYAPTRHKSAS